MLRTIARPLQFIRQNRRESDNKHASAPGLPWSLQVGRFPPNSAKLGGIRKRDARPRAALEKENVPNCGAMSFGWPWRKGLPCNSSGPSRPEVEMRALRVAPKLQDRSPRRPVARSAASAPIPIPAPAPGLWLGENAPEDTHEGEYADDGDELHPERSVLDQLNSSMAFFFDTTLY